MRFQLSSKAARRVIAVLCVGVTAWLAFAQVAMGTTKPTLTLTLLRNDGVDCELYGEPIYGFTFGGAGWPPNTDVTFKATTGYFTSYPSLGGTTTTASGEIPGFGYGLFSPIWGFTTVEAFVDTDNNLQPDPGAVIVIARIDNPCGPPTLTKEQCKNGGYSALRFNSQGECVAFVERGSKP